MMVYKCRMNYSDNHLTESLFLIILVVETTFLADYSGKCFLTHPYGYGASCLGISPVDQCHADIFAGRDGLIACGHLTDNLSVAFHRISGPWNRFFGQLDADQLTGRTFRLLTQDAVTPDKLLLVRFSVF